MSCHRDLKSPYMASEYVNEPFIMKVTRGGDPDLCGNEMKYRDIVET